MTPFNFAGKVLEVHGAAAAAAVTGWIFSFTVDATPLPLVDVRHLGIHSLGGLVGCFVLVANTTTGRTARGLIGLFVSAAILGALFGAAVTELTGQPYLGLAAAGASGYSVLGFIANPAGWFQQAVALIRGRSDPAKPPQDKPPES